ncbi:exodeoxyribonuclease VII large subunit [Lentisalinibacter orientalis]|uniref:exodeoxyribonuclease VII large subunit n=1 Tax=Lentisalinibacter orientalis TaxID=2992241 RepID=UPI003865E597
MDAPLPGAGRERPLTVSELNRDVRTLLETELPRLWVEGEISNLARPASGHVYFSLKDDGAQIRCAFFRQRQRGLAFRPENGQQVLVRGRVSLYEPRGDYQMIVEQMEEAGEGELRRRFDALKKKLTAEGLFDEALKRPIPRLPRRIGIVTSPTGAAVRDILHVLARRFPAVPVIVYPTAVQGDAAAAEIVAALETAGRRAECDVLILARGGGSLEDLWSFNEEAVARAVRASPVPVVAGVGHEIDFTIADFAADLRAPTPSGAAELVVPDWREWSARLEQAGRRLATGLDRRLEDRGQTLDRLARRLTLASPARRLRHQQERLDSLSRRMTSARSALLTAAGHRLERLEARLLAASPGGRLKELHGRWTLADRALRRTMPERLQALRTRLAGDARALNTVSPLATLERGYAIVTAEPDGTVLRDAAGVEPGTRIRARLARGALAATVQSAEVPEDEE